MQNPSGGICLFWGYQLGMAIQMREYAVHADYVHIHENADVDTDENLGKYRRMCWNFLSVLK